MSIEKRRNAILDLLRKKDSPLPGARLAEAFSVSRQIIVSDIAALKEAGYDIVSTHGGYILPASSRCLRVFKVKHSDDEIRDELYTIVDMGGGVVDVFVKHKAYDEIRATLNIYSRRDVDEFVDKIETGKSTPLKNITSNYHYHTIDALSEEVLDLIEDCLRNKNMLAEFLGYETKE